MHSQDGWKVLAAGVLFTGIAIWLLYVAYRDGEIPLPGRGLGYATREGDPAIFWICVVAHIAFAGLGCYFIFAGATGMWRVYPGSPH